MPCLDPCCPKNNFTATRDPSVSDCESRGFCAGSYWYNAATGRLFIGGNMTCGNAIWIPVTPNKEPLSHVNVRTQPLSAGGSAIEFPKRNTLPPGVENGWVFNPPLKQYDTLSEWSNGFFTPQYSGYYLITTFIYVECDKWHDDLTLDSPPATIFGCTYVNNGHHSHAIETPTIFLRKNAIVEQHAHGSDSVYLKAGDKLCLHINTGNYEDFTFRIKGHSFLHIDRLADWQPK